MSNNLWGTRDADIVNQVSTVIILVCQIIYMELEKQILFCTLCDYVTIFHIHMDF